MGHLWRDMTGRGRRRGRDGGRRGRERKGKDLCSTTSMIGVGISTEGRQAGRQEGRKYFSTKQSASRNIPVKNSQLVGIFQYKTVS